MAGDDERVDRGARKALERLVRKGLVERIGVSNFSEEEVEQLLRVLRNQTEREPNRVPSELEARRFGQVL